jgi:hypothetical protein
LPGSLDRDSLLLLSTRFIRLFAYDAISIVLVFYLRGLGLTEPQTGLLLTLTLVGDAESGEGGIDSPPVNQIGK